MKDKKIGLLKKSIYKENEHGITLIALVVTIIILLILASIGLNSLNRGNGVIKETQGARDAAQTSGAKEKLDLAIINASNKGKELDADILIDEIEKKGGTGEKTDDGFPVKATIDDNDFWVDNDGNVYDNEDDARNNSNKILFAASTMKWTNQDVTITAKCQNEKLIVETSVNNGNYEQISERKFTSNGTITARLKGSTKTFEYTVANIDKVLPILTEKSKATDSITISATDDESGIVGYAITTANTVPTSFTAIESTKSFNRTFSDLKAGTKYYVWVKDAAGNVNTSKEITTKTIPSGTTAGVIALNPSTTDWTNKDIIVTASTNTAGFHMQLSIGGISNFKDATTATITGNTTVYGRLRDDSNNYGTASAALTITKIDKLPPTNTAPTLSRTSSKITATFNQVDREPANGSGKSEIKTKEYAISTDGTTYGSWQTSNVFSNLTQDTLYYVKTRATDYAGNVQESLVSSIKTTTVPNLVPANVTFSYSPTGWTNKDVTATAGTTEKGYIMQTSKDGKNWENTSDQTYSENGIIYARLSDGTNVGDCASGNITNIDKTPPIISNLKVSITNSSSKDITVTFDKSDSSSNVKDSFDYSTDNSSYDSATGTSVKLTGLSTEKDYTAYIKIYDNAGNEASASKQFKIGSNTTQDTYGSHDMQYWYTSSGSYGGHNMVYDHTSSPTYGSHSWSMTGSIDDDGDGKHDRVYFTCSLCNTTVIRPFNSPYPGGTCTSNIISAGGPVYKCSYCGTTSSSSSLSGTCYSHYYSGTTYYKCSYCGRSSTSSSNSGTCTSHITSYGSTTYYLY